jgi:RES domain-containing protein
MLLRAFRITPKAIEGATLLDIFSSSSGRWHPAGYPGISYAGSTISLAALECLVWHRVADLIKNFVVFFVTFSEELVETMPLETLNKSLPDWRQNEVGCQRIGLSWMERAAKPILAVPSKIVPIEVNYVLNFNHPDFPRKHASSIPWKLDDRITSRESVSR